MFLLRTAVRTISRTLSRTFCSRPVLTLFTKDPCPLCDEAKEALEPFRHRFLLKTVDISHSENRQWLDRYRYHIPVFHLNGTEIMRHRVDPERLERALTEARQNRDWDKDRDKDRE